MIYSLPTNLLVRYYKVMIMEKVTIQDVRDAIREVVKNQQMHDLLENLDDDKLFKSSVEQDLHMISGQIREVIEQLSKNKQIYLPHELYKVLPDNIVQSIVDTVNLCIQEEEELGISVAVRTV